MSGWCSFPMSGQTRVAKNINHNEELGDMQFS